MKDINTLIEEVNRMEREALMELRKMFLGYAEAKYWQIIGNDYGNQYIDEYLGEVQESVLKSIKNFNGSTREMFCGYINECITNCCKKFYRDNIESKYKLLSLNEKYGVVGISSHFFKNGNVEAFVVSKITKYEIIFVHMLPELTNVERGAILRKIGDVETVEEYAERVACAENTIRARESKAIKKMKQKAASKRLKELYHL